MKDDIERRKSIIDRIIAGEKQTSIAEDLGVTRQAINHFWTKYKALGDQVIYAPKRGRIKEKDLLTKDEKKQMVEWVRTHKPSDIGEDGDEWTLILVKRAIFFHLRKRVKIPIAHGVFHAAFPDYNKKFGETANLAPVIRKRTRGRPPKKKAKKEETLQSPEPSPPLEEPPPEPSPLPAESTPVADALIDPDEEDLSIEEMAKMNEETLKTPAGQAYLRSQQEKEAALAGKRKKTPRTPPKRRRKKKR